MISLIDFVCYTALVALVVKFILTIADKWGIIEWCQLHAPNDFLEKLARCNFCQSFWLGVIICIPLAILVDWPLIFIPICSSSLR